MGLTHPLFAWHPVAILRLLRVVLAATIGFVWAEEGQPQPFCSHKLPWEECAEHLPSEKAALASFLSDLKRSPMPSASAFQGRGIVMSGGAQHVLQALANLDVLRSQRKSYLPVEFWHAFELEDAHCEALAASGAVCRQLNMPGVYKEYATIVPAIMSSSFQHVLWMDTDITPLVSPDILFETEAYKQDGALFWPDHWSHDCYPFGESSWHNHVALQLLQLKFNVSEPRYSQEHETGYFLINKQKHWRVICLANYLATRHFFTRVLVGCKDAFRLAFLKLNVSHWLSPVRPGLVGLFLQEGRFYPAATVQFWPFQDALGEARCVGKTGRHIPLYVHQKKVPGLLSWTDIVTFQQPMGQCTRFKLEPLDVTLGDRNIWDVENTDPEVAQNLHDAEDLWEKSFAANLDKLLNHPGLSNKSKGRLTVKTDPKVLSQKWDRLTRSCRCDFGNNLWLHLLTFLIPGEVERGMSLKEGNCGVVLQPDLDPISCPIGFATLAVVCHELLDSKADKMTVKKVVADLLPGLEKCLPKTFWPLKLDDLRRFLDGSHGYFDGHVDLHPHVVSELADPLRRCLPLKLPDCWHPKNALTQTGGVMKDTNVGVKNSCILCCGSGNSSECFDAVYTEDTCCNTLEMKKGCVATSFDRFASRLSRTNCLRKTFWSLPGCQVPDLQGAGNAD